MRVHTAYLLEAALTGAVLTWLFVDFINDITEWTDELDEANKQREMVRQEAKTKQLLREVLKDIKNANNATA